MTKKFNLLPLAGLILFSLVVLLGEGTPLGVERAEAAIAFRAAAQAGVSTIAAPTFQAAGTGVNGAAAITAAWPAHLTNDIGLLIIETDNQAVTLGANAADWTQVTNSPKGTGTPGAGSGLGAPSAAATRLTVFWSRATSSTMGSVGVNDSGNHQRAQILTFRGVVASGNPWDVTAGDVDATQVTAVSIPGATTTVANTLVVAIVANAWDATAAQTSGWANANLATLTERADGNAAAGNGGGFGVATGVMAAAGAYAATTATLANVSVQGRMSIALRPSMTLTINTPTGTVQNDVMVASIAFRPLSGQFSSDITVTDPLGWTRLDFFTNTANYNALAIYYRVAGASEPASYAWEFACNASCTLNSAAGGIVSFSGVDTTNPIDQNAGAATPATLSPLTPSVTTTVADAMLVTTHAIDNNTLWQNPPPSGMTQAFQQTTSSQMIQVSRDLQPAAGPTGQKQATDLGAAIDADVGHAHILALRPLCSVAISDAAYVAANAQNGQATVYWSSANPVLILRKSGTSITDAPTNGTSYIAGNTIGASSVAYSGSVVETSFSQGSLTNATTYYYKLFANSGTCYSPGTEVNARPQAPSTGEGWSYMLAGGSALRMPTTDDSGNVYVASNAARIMSLDGTTGTQNWAPFSTNAAVQGYQVWTSLTNGISLVQATAKFNTASGTSTTSPAFGSNPVVGNRIIVLAWAYNNTTPTLTASDNKGNTYTADAQISTGIQNAAIFSAPVTLTGASFTVTVTSATGASQIEAVAMEYSGLGARDQTGTITGTAASPTVSTAGATADANQLVVSVLGIDQPGVVFTSITPATGWTDRATQLNNSGNTGGEGSDKIVTSTGVQTQTWTTNPASTAWAAVIATYHPAAVAAQRVFSGDQSGTVYAVNPATGTTASPGWQVTPAGSTAIQAGVSIQLRAYSNSAFTTAYSNGAYDVVFAATSNASTTNNKVFALRSDTGATLWTFPLAAQNVDQIIGQPWVDYTRNYLYVTSKAGAGAQSSLWVLDSRNGSIITSFNTLGQISTAPTQSYDQTTVWVGNENGAIYAINLTTAPPTLKWAAPLALGAAAKLVGFVWEDYSTPNRSYFSTADGKVRCFQDPGIGGTPLTSSACSGGWPAVSSGVSVPGATGVLLLDKIYVGSWNGTTGTIVAIDPATGAAGTPFTVGDGTKQVGDLSTVTGAELLIGTTEGKVFKISLPLP
jgi:outer membrane protein assembly factor BamB